MPPLTRTASTQLFVQVQVPQSWGDYQAGLAIEKLKHNLYSAGVEVGEAESELNDTADGEYMYRLNVWCPYAKLGAVTDVLRALPEAAK